ncbi:sorting nexin-29 [Daktulosphaira vitifoliae]|uniref:sorting nexin-29 n=1 Tax=Daktulosphaira vitifoliae TaxID=58002 RepID=UPI0021AA3E3A|nr:sorting nexin-29 [Daktulosphaira vitifoliae]
MAHVSISQSGRCERLQRNLLDSVKQCQKRFGNCSEIATESDQEVAYLCQCFEAVLSHGLKINKTEEKNSLIKRKVSKIVNGLSDSDKCQNQTVVSFWCFIKEILKESEIERFHLLTSIKNEYGRGKAWLRASINERCLEKYMHLCISSNELISKFYEEWAFMSNYEKNAILPNIAAGLSSIVFALNIDKIEYNKDMTEPVLNEPIIDGEGDFVLKKDNSEKGKKIKANFIYFDKNNDIQPAEEVKSDDDVLLAVGDDIPSGSSFDKTTGYFIGEFKDLPSTEKELERRFRKLSPINESNEVYEFFVPVTSLSPHCDTDDESKSLGSNDENNSLNKYDNSNDQLLLMEKHFQEKTSELEAKITELVRENDLLKHQLRKYVSAVQLMKQDENESEEVKLYQQKLIQVAEMHSELIELNSRLNDQMMVKDHFITKLRTELVALRGPLPSDEIPHTNIHLWVPSAFLVGRINDPHHVYQIHVRILNEEWNVYRRYSQFTEFHKQLKKQYSVVSTIALPPKKTIGNKGVNFVEERRKKLQVYLRQIINFLISINQLLANSPNKYKLVNLIPFFSEQYNQSHNGKRSWLNLGCLVPQNSVIELNSSSQPQYTGL